ncbi:(E3-independent) E2 ubiquitin-conjugating enzyme UBE2O [Lingula anatina]|uniref:(E3-independent) E2 ubiquitin-conjugating enzyme UBE2O n=1 Tax=Lingula anatina TaxID=7574 RepID=A0A1S3JQ03_LINAN|nr:(E3-independent) E2 ubiquitin-conjugating enzyme UBE2O [Lingula anatina]|eukprot:XP_013412226.1 (E3-independent) E2 ubiquitin-conjugating enzyme UBE2O [Lingula anatina]
MIPISCATFPNMATCTIFDEDEVCRIDSKKGAMYGLIIESSEYLSSDEDEDNNDNTSRVRRGTVRVAWHPRGEEEVVPEKKLKLVDRSLMPGDVVRRLIQGENSQRGFVSMTDITCHVLILGTNKVITNVNTKELRNLEEWDPEPGDVTLDSWVGRIDLINQELILKFADGARCQIEESELYDFEDVCEKRDDGTEFYNQAYYPGQHLVGNLGELSKAKWLSTTKHHSAWTVETNRLRKVHVSVEKVMTKSIEVHWTCRGYATHTDTKVDPPPRVVKDDNLQRLKSLDMFSSCSYQLGDKCFYTIKDTDDIQTVIPSKGRSHASYLTKDSSTITEDSTKSATKFSVLARNKANKSGHNVEKIIECGESSEGNASAAAMEDMLNAKNNASQKETFITGSAVSKTAGDEADAMTPDETSVINMESEQPSCTAASDSVVTMPSVPADLETPSAMADPGPPALSGDTEAAVSFSSTTDLGHSTIPENPEAKITSSTVAGTTGITTTVESVTQEANVLAGNTSSKAGSEDTGFAEDSTSEEEEDDDNEDDDGTDTGSLTSSQSDASGPSSKKKKSRTFTGLKFKHKLKGKKSKSLLQIQPQKEFKAGESVAVEVMYTYSHADVMWQDGSIEKSIPSTELYPIHHLDELEFFPGDFVVPAKVTDVGSEDQYGVVVTVDHQQRTCIVKWMKTGEENNPEEVGEPIEMSVYDVKDHPDFKFRLGHVVVKIGGEREIEASSAATGQVCDVTPGGRIGVHWVDGSTSYCYPCHLYLVTDEMSEEWESGSESEEDSDVDSWETEEEEEVDEEEAEKEKDIEVQAIEKKLRDVETMMQRMDKNFNDLFTSMEKMDQVLNRDTMTISSYSKVFYEPILGFLKQCKTIDKNLGTRHFKDTGVQEVYKVVESEIEKERATRKARKALSKLNMQKNVKTKKDSVQSDDDVGNAAGNTTNDAMSSSAAKPNEEKNSGKETCLSGNVSSFKQTKPEENLKGSSASAEESKNPPETSTEVTTVVVNVNQNAGEGATAATSTGLSSFTPSSNAEQRSKVKDIWEMACKCLKKQFSLTQEEIKSLCKGNIEHLKGELKKLGTDQHDESLHSATSVDLPGDKSVGEDMDETLDNLTSAASNPDAAAKMEENVTVETPASVTSIADTELKENMTALKDEATSTVEEEMNGNLSLKEMEEEEAKIDDSEENKSVFVMLEEVPAGHKFKNKEHQPADSKMFLGAVRKELKLLRGHLPSGIVVKGFEDRMDLYSVMFVGPANTPYEDGLFFFDIQLPSDYPTSPPVFHYLAFCSDRLNPNLYEDGKVCVSLLGTWGGKGSEVWTSKSNLLQVFVSIQGLILNAEPYYNEAGYERQRGTQQGMENSKVYNEMAVIKLLQSMIRMVCNPPDLFKDEFREHLQHRTKRMIQRLKYWVQYSENLQKSEKLASSSSTTKLQSPNMESKPESPNDTTKTKASVDSLKADTMDATASSRVPSVSEKPEGSRDSQKSMTLDATEEQPVPSSSSEVLQETSLEGEETATKKVQESEESAEPNTSAVTFILPDFPLLPGSKGFCMSLKSLLQELKERTEKYLLESAEKV